ncbi:MAG: efflux RND transporter periplasmic adaptor subunit [Betaproteobacteria bacterium]|nr:efflux RND transporter periplasmic adaptor subunit [Betaproteobacteria bacterium]
MRGKSSMVRAHWVRLSLIGGGMLLWGEVSAGDITDSMNSYEGVVEAERQTLIAPQVAATVREILVRPGEVVKAGQVMIRLDVQEASQVAAVSAAQVRAAQAVLAEAQQDENRQKQLFAQGYISQVAWDRAEARFQSAQAVAQAQSAQSSSAMTKVSYYVLRAPYDGVVADVPGNLGQMALPGHTLVNFYDPTRLRVTAQLPQSVTSTMEVGSTRLEWGNDQGQEPDRKPSYLTVLPTVDPLSHTVQVRMGLTGQGLPKPGTFVRIWLPADRTKGIWVPRLSIVQRAEMTGIYVRDGQGQPLLRQVRLGRAMGSEVEILSGVGEHDAVLPDARSVFNQGH